MTDKLKQDNPHIPLNRRIFMWLGCYRDFLPPGAIHSLQEIADAAAGTNGAEDIKWAARFHEAYERLAPDYGYATRTDTAIFDPGSANGRLMRAVMREVFIPALRGEK